MGGATLGENTICCLREPPLRKLGGLALVAAHETLNHGKGSAVFAFFVKWEWLIVLSLGAVNLSMGYKLFPTNEAWHKKNGRLMKVSGYLMILGSLYLLLVDKAG